jgi:PAS domain-containing protein
MERLRELQSELGIAQQDATTAARRYDALRDALPLACVVTDRAGTIVEANAAAVALLNTSERHLVGKPLVIFLEERDRFLATLNAADELRFEAAVRPRDRKSRDAVIHVHTFEGSEHRCVFLRELDPRSAWAR